MSRGLVIVLEGADGAGKSTIADTLEEAALRDGRLVNRVHNMPPVPRSQSSTTLFATYLGQLDIATRMSRCNVTTIIDRSWVSEVVYGELYRDGSLITPAQVRKFEKYATAKHIVLLGVKTPLAIRERRILNRGEKLTLDAEVGISYDTYFHANKAWTTVDGSSTPRIA